jgi:riboflavin biosynthesis pyrimidine reductase
MRTISVPRNVISSPQPASHSGHVLIAVVVPFVPPMVMGAMLPLVRQLFPVLVDEIDPAQCYAADERPARGWVLVNMITTVDGATAAGGRSGALGGAADKRVFAAIRSVADTILVGAGTVRAENYGAPKGGARLAICSGSLDLSTDARVFTEGHRPIVITHAASDQARRAALAEVAEVRVYGDDRVDLEAAVRGLDGVVLCEGGPSLNGDLIATGLVDEFCLSLAPLLAAGGSSRVAHGPELAQAHGMRLDRVLEEDGYVFFRYIRP